METLVTATMVTATMVTATVVMFQSADEVKTTNMPSGVSHSMQPKGKTCCLTETTLVILTQLLLILEQYKNCVNSYNSVSSSQ